MAQANFTPISLYFSTTPSAAPTAGNLVNGELAINITDGKLYYKDNAGTVKVIAGAGGTGVVAGSNTQVQFNNNGVFGASANMTFDGTTLTVAGLSNTGNTTLGNASADTVTVSGTITSNLIFTDNTYDIGASGATRPRTGYFGTSVITPALTVSGLTSGRVPYLTTGGLFTSSANLIFSGQTLFATNNGAATGPTVPSYALEVAGNTNLAFAVTATGETYTAGTASSKFEYVQSGTLGIVTATTTTVNSGALIDFNAYNSSGGATNIYLGAVASSAVGGGPANFVLGRRTAVASWAESLRVDSSGYLGIGTNSPISILNASFSGGTVSGTHSMAFGFPYAANLQLKSTNAGTSVAVASVGLYGNPERTREFAFYDQATDARVGYLGYQYGSGGVITDLKLFNALAGALTFSTNNTEVGRFANSGSFLLGTSSASGAKMDLAFSTTQNGLVIAPTSFVYPTYSLLTTNGVIGTVKSGSQSINLIDIRAQEQTSVANGIVTGGYFQIDNPNAAVNANGGQIGVYGLVNGVNNYTVGHQYGVYGRAGSGGTNGIGVMAVLGADIQLGTRAALVALTNNTTDRIASFQNSGGEYVQINGLGSLGIQTTPNRWFSNRSVIQMGSSVGAIAALNGYEIGLNFYVAETTAIDKRAQTGYANKMYSDSAVGDILWATAGTGAGDSNITWSERMRLVNAGGLAIGGTTAPRLLTVSGSGASISLNDTNGGIYFGTGGSGGGGFASNCAVARASTAGFHIASSSVGDLCIGPDAGSNIRFGYAASGDPSLSLAMTIASTGVVSTAGNLSVGGALSKGSGSFRIEHPLPQLAETHQLVHSFIEGPQADLIYRGKVSLVDGKATVNIDQSAGMTEGTFVVLCRDVQCFTTNESDWTAVRGAVSGNILTIEAQDQTSTSSISWMVIGERQDKHMYDTDWTDDNGKVIVEPLKPIEA